MPNGEDIKRRAPARTKSATSSSGFSRSSRSHRSAFSSSTTTSISQDGDGDGDNSFCVPLKRGEENMKRRGVPVRSASSHSHHSILSASTTSLSLENGNDSFNLDNSFSSNVDEEQGGGCSGGATSSAYYSTSPNGSSDTERLLVMVGAQEEDGIPELKGIKKSMKNRFRSLLIAVAMVLTLSTLLVCWNLVAHSSKNGSARSSGGTNNRGQKIPISYQCPAEKHTNGQKLQYEYNALDDEHLSKANVTEFLANFREATYDAWGQSYNKVKGSMTDFKSKHFPKYLSRPGSTVYESACGIGLNLYMTLEIVRDYSPNNNTDIVVYGNEYLQESVNKGDEIVLDNLPGNARKGSICQGDSMNLRHVPSESFDVSYTGYVTPLLDPLSLKEDDRRSYRKICRTLRVSNTSVNYNKDLYWMAQTLEAEMQRKQEERYGLWVKEMARIAKPGAPVIIEHTAMPLCSSVTSMNDWGGVDKDFWEKHARANTYGWDIDPDSIEIEDEILYTKEKKETERYHVFMLKNSKKKEGNEST